MSKTISGIGGGSRRTLNGLEDSSSGLSTNDSLIRTNNLNDLTNIPLARANLGLNGNLTTSSPYLSISQPFNGVTNQSLSLLASTFAIPNYLAAYDASGLLTATLSGNVIGNVTGNLSGNVTGNLSGNVTGNLSGSVIGGDVTATKIAINTSISPTNALQINGDVDISGNYKVNGVPIGTTSSPTYDSTKDKARVGIDANGIYVTTGNGTTQTDRMRIMNDGTVGIGTFPTRMFDVGGDINFSGNLYKNGIPFALTADASWLVAGNNYSTGNLALGHNNPTSKLHVIGSSRLDGATTITGTLTSAAISCSSLTSSGAISAGSANISTTGSMSAGKGLFSKIKGNGVQSIYFQNQVETENLAEIGFDTIDPYISCITAYGKLISRNGNSCCKLCLDASSGTGGRYYEVLSTGANNSGGAGNFQVWDLTNSRPVMHIDKDRNVEIYGDVTLVDGVVKTPSRPRWAMRGNGIVTPLNASYSLANWQFLSTYNVNTTYETPPVIIYPTAPAIDIGPQTITTSPTITVTNNQGNMPAWGNTLLMVVSPYYLIASFFRSVPENDNVVRLCQKLVIQRAGYYAISAGTGTCGGGTGNSQFTVHIMAKIEGVENILATHVGDGLTSSGSSSRSVLSIASIYLNPMDEVWVKSLPLNGGTVTFDYTDWFTGYWIDG